MEVWRHLTSLSPKTLLPHHASAYLYYGFAYIQAFALRPESNNWLWLASFVTPSVTYVVQEYKPVVLSTTLFSLALGPDLPWVDELYPGTLSQSVNGILTHFSLLTPAFSLLSAPIVLTVYLQRT